MESLWLIFALGLLLGVRHALDADHLIAVSTIVSEYKNHLKAIWIGVSWGMGHTTTLLLAGIAILFLKISISDKVAHVFEFLVGIMLVALGLQIFWNIRKRRIHIHAHPSPQGSHGHFHSHEEKKEHNHHSRLNMGNIVYFLIAGIIPGEHRENKTMGPGKPFFRLKSYLVGTVHGLAGSATLLLLVLASLKSTWDGVIYILLFGLGSVVSMGLITIGISMPFALSSRLPRINDLIQALAGAVSIIFGFILMYRIGIIEGLFS